VLLAGEDADILGHCHVLAAMGSGAKPRNDSGVYGRGATGGEMANSPSGAARKPAAQPSAAATNTASPASSGIGVAMNSSSSLRFRASPKTAKSRASTAKLPGPPTTLRR